MAHVVAILLALVPMMESSSRYFIYTFSNPFGPASNIPYPVDVCVNYHIGLHLFRPIYQYAMFTCNENNDGIIMTTYGADSECQSSGSIDSTYSSQSFSKQGDLYSFNCIGDNNYAEALVYQKDDTCCGDKSMPSKVATAVCYPNADGSRYLMSTCDATGSGATYASNTEDCNGDNTTITTGNTNECRLFKTDPTNLYIRFNKCIEGGQIIAESSFCVEPTVAPNTKRPTNVATTGITKVSMEASMKPSPAPSVVPIVVSTTAVASNSDVSMMDGVIFGACVMLLVIGLAVYCYVRRKKKPYKKEEGLMAAEQGSNVLERIALDDVIENDEMEGVTEEIVQEEQGEDDQEIVGTANEIDIAEVNPVQEVLQSD